MQTFLIVVYLLVVVALVCIILLQPSDGGGLASSNSGANFMSARGAANALTRLTSILAIAFFVLALLLFVLQTVQKKDISGALDYVPDSSKTNLLDQIGGAPTADDAKAVDKPESVPSGL